MQVFILIFLAMLVQVAAAVVTLRMRRSAGPSLAWLCLFAALVLMALRRAFLLVEYARNGFPAYLLPNEVMSLLISVLLLGGMFLVQGILRDREEQANRLEEARERAREEADKLTALMRAIPVPLWIAEDAECRVVRGNPAGAGLLRMTHGPDGSLVDSNQPRAFRMIQDGHELLPEEMPLRRAARGEEVREESVDLVFAGDAARRLMAYATPLRHPDGRIQGAICCLVDLTEFRRVEGALARAHKMESLGMLAGGIAHDFNNIFQAMVASLELIRRGLAPASPTLAHLDRLEASLDRASRLSRDVLHCSGGDLRRPEFLDLSSQVAEALDGLDLPVTRDLPAVLPRVMMDPVLIGRVVEGLVLNALEADSAVEDVRVRTFMRNLNRSDLLDGHWAEPLGPGLYAVLEVSDRGDGIGTTTLPKIFDPFFTTRNVGRGLGLPAALGIVRGHHGGIQVESIAGEGSVFRAYLPVPHSLEAPPAPPGRPTSARNLVLLADDEPDLRFVLAEMLQSWFGLEVVCAADGQEALDLFRQRPHAFDLVILDATMPRLGGVEAFRAMREIQPDFPGVLCSGYALASAREQAVAQGFVDFLKKPFSSGDLKALLDRVLGAREPGSDSGRIA
ncbi:response regulator [Geothrix sp. 21YS21S-4]|uniref:hybrid sensor histidine kinase/response regulator n=1 Tax=Geothrix sp. 21YS21S-4 TaxID=3068889 RepID=UPI0027BA7D08|nr:response regulator [Geothrix sp. 21YS21S-4]